MSQNIAPGISSRKMHCITIAIVKAWLKLNLTRFIMFIGNAKRIANILLTLQ